MHSHRRRSRQYGGSWDLPAIQHAAMAMAARTSLPHMLRVVLTCWRIPSTTSSAMPMSARYVLAAAHGALSRRHALDLIAATPR
jgi:hypothetical protein